MGWSKRGNGKSYDSLNGYGTIIGYLSKKILDFGTRNRKCKMCNNGHEAESHICRRNYEGSAKSMEADLAASLVNESDILTQAGVSVRVLVGDDDSSAISAIIQGTTHKIFKLSCRVHLSKKFVKNLYKLKQSHPHLGKKGVIAHLRKCFAYALAQNAGNSEKIKASILTILDHVYDNHDNCGDWCKKELKKHTIKLTSETLHPASYDVLLKYANNSTKFSVAATSQLNEMFDSIVAHKMPKINCYSLSASSDYRVASAVLNFNDGEQHLMEIEKKLGLPF